MRKPEDPRLAKLKAAVKSMEAVMEAYADAGATDTEPDGTWQVLLVRAFKGQNPQVPDTPRGWDLYSDRADGQEAAKALYHAASASLGVLKEILATIPYAEVGPIRAYLADYCWRVSW